MSNGEARGSRALAGTPGLNIFKITGQSISGWLPSYKAGKKQPFTSLIEFALALYLEYHPRVSVYQRGDAETEFARAHGLTVPLGTPYRISYIWEGTSHDYLPDWVGTLSNNGLPIAEGGLSSRKVVGQNLAKADAARRLAQIQNGRFWVATEDLLATKRHQNLLFLHGRRQGFATFTEIAPYVREIWLSGEAVSVRCLCARLGRRWSDQEVEAAAWKVAAEATASGHLLLDLSAFGLTLDSPIRLLDPGEPPILPDDLPSSFVSDQPGDATTSVASEPQLLLVRHLPGPSIDGAKGTSACIVSGIGARSAMPVTRPSARPKGPRSIACGLPSTP